MKTAGIICEYNPLHNGHAYHIEMTRSLCGADYIICVMSGNFTQRGEPACCDKYIRTGMALLAGCDLVIELPARYATSSAEGFAAAAVNMLAATGVVTDLCFGSEEGRLETFETISDILTNEPPEYSSALKDALKSGMSYPAARQRALLKYMDLHDISSDISFTPNNILAIEYLRACKYTNIIPHTIKRSDNGYLQADLSAHSSNLCSSSAIRRYILENKGTECADFSLLKEYMPEASYNLLMQNIQNTVTANDFSEVLYSQLQNNMPSLSDYLDVGDDIANRIRNNLNHFSDFETFASHIKTKQVTHAHIMRALTHIMLGIKKYDNEYGIGDARTNLKDACTNIVDARTVNEKYPVSYIRILGFRKESAKLMKAVSNNASVPVITRPAAAQQVIGSSYGNMLFAEDVRSADIYRYIQTCNTQARDHISRTKNEYTHGLIIV